CRRPGAGSPVAAGPRRFSAGNRIRSAPVATAANTTTIPWDWYSDPAVARLEQSLIFRRSWQYAGHTGDLAEPGSFTTSRAGDVPVVLGRGRDEMLRAFVNVCRHRGYTLCEGTGRRETLQCPY